MKSLRLKVELEDWQIDAVKVARKFVAYIQDFKKGDEYPFKDIDLDSVLGAYIAIYTPCGMTRIRIAFANVPQVIMRELRDYIQTISIDELQIPSLAIIPLEKKEKDKLDGIIA